MSSSRLAAEVRRRRTVRISIFGDHADVGEVYVRAEHAAQVLSLLNGGLIEACERHLEQCVVDFQDGFRCYVCGFNFESENQPDAHGKRCTVPRLQAELANAKGGG